MDQNLFLLTFIGISCAFTLYRAVMSPWQQQVRGWIYVSLAILFVMGFTYVTVPEDSGIISGLVWGVFWLVPSLGSRRVMQLILRQDFDRAMRWSKFLSFLHPFDGWQVQPEVIRALRLAQQGKTAQAVEILERYENIHSPMATTARMHLYRLQNRWQDLVFSLERSADLAANPNTISAYIRALGETGDLNRMIAAFMRLRSVITQSRTTGNIALFVFAFTGQRDQLDQLFEGPLRLYPYSLQQYWQALADQAAGKLDTARQSLSTLTDIEDFSIREAVHYRLEHALPLAQSILTADSLHSLDEIARELEQEQRFGRIGTVKQIRPYATYALIAINVIVFIVEIFSGGSEDKFTLLRMGALFPEWVLSRGEWWRMLAAMFLHAGLLHIAANMFALLMIGPFVEYVLGIRRYLLTYFAAGLGSMLLIVWMTSMGWMGNEILVGASGAIMGIVGAMGAIMFRGWRVEHASVARQRLIQIVTIVALQVFIDKFLIPESSLQGHLGGAVIGFLVAGLLRHHVQAPPATVAVSEEPASSG